METKYITIPFDLERAKRITKGEEKGKIVTRDGRSVRIICWDAHRDDNIIALIEDEKGIEFPICYVSDGLVFLKSKSNCDLMLSVPEWTTFKDGDIISYESGTLILKNIDGKDRVEYYANLYGLCTAFDSACLMKNLVNHLRISSEEEKQKLIVSLKESKNPRAKEYLKRFFGIEVKKEFDFKPFDKVLVRDGREEKWLLSFFSYYDNEQDIKFCCLTTHWKYCIPYNEQTKHLVGTSDNWEE